MLPIDFVVELLLLFFFNFVTKCINILINHTIFVFPVRVKIMLRAFSIPLASVLLNSVHLESVLWRLKIVKELSSLCLTLKSTMTLKKRCVCVCSYMHYICSRHVCRYLCLSVHVYICRVSVS